MVVQLYSGKKNRFFHDVRVIMLINYVKIIMFYLIIDGSTKQDNKKLFSLCS